MAHLASSAGYQALMDSNLARPYYHNEIITKGWGDDILPYITSSDFLNELTSCYQVANVMTEPDVGEWRPLELNQRLEADTVSSSGFSVKICWGVYKALKFDNHDVNMICDRWDMFEESFLSNLWNQLSAKWRCYVLDMMVLQADSCNKGCHAGIHGNINLGCLGQPRPINGDVLAIELNKLQLVLRQRKRWHNGEMVLLMSSDLSSAFVDSPYADASVMGNCVNCSHLIPGEFQHPVMGFQVIITDDIQTNPELGGKVASYVIAAHRRAMAFVGDIIESRIVEPTEYFGTQYQLAAVYGGEAIYPDAIVIGYWMLAGSYYE